MKNPLRRKFMWSSLVAPFLNYIKELILDVMALIGSDIKNLLEFYLINPPKYIHAIHTYMHAQYDNLTISPVTENI